MMKNLYLLWAACTISIFSFTIQAQELPVRISSFNLSNQNREVKLQWTVSCGVEMAYFEIQRSVDGKNFKNIHQFSADRVRCSEPFDYLDNSATNENYYRIRVGDIDGNFTQERVQYISTKSIPGASVEVNSPVRGRTLQLSLMADQPTDVHLRLVSMNGRELEKIKMTIPAGYSSSIWEIPTLPNGIYFVGFANSTSTIRGVSRFLIVN